jgi:hypothetical protein
MREIEREFVYSSRIMFFFGACCTEAVLVLATVEMLSPSLNYISFRLTDGRIFMLILRNS